MSTRRWNKEKDWVRLLPRADKRTQTEELLDIQYISNNNTRSVLSNIYNSFYVVEGLEVIITSQENRTAFINGGRFYIEIDDQFYISEVNSTYLTLPLGDSYIGITSQLLELDSSTVQLNPSIAPYIAGSLGAKRLYIKSKITINNPNSYPIAYISKVGDRLEVINNRLGSTLDNLLNNQWEEETGDFIAKGLQVYINDRLSIDPGKAYIKGLPIRVNYPSSLSIPTVTGCYSLRLNTSGIVSLHLIGGQLRHEIVTITSSTGTPITNTEEQPLIDLISDSTYISREFNCKPYIELAKLEIDSNIRLIPNLNRSVSNTDLSLLEFSSNNNSQALTRIYSELITRDKGFQYSLIGIHSDPLINTKYSDIYHPLYSAHISSIGVHTSVTNTSLIPNIEVVNLVRVINGSNGTPSYVHPSISSREVIKEDRPASSITLTKSGISSSIYPLVLYIDRNNQSLEQTNLYITYKGLIPNTSYSLYLNEFYISTFIYPLELITDVNGTLEISFTSPSNIKVEQLTDESIYLYLRRGTQTIHVDQLNLITNESGLVNTNLTTNPNLPSTNLIAQSFFIEQDTMLSSAGIRISSIPNTIQDPTRPLLNLSIVENRLGVPCEDKVLYNKDLLLRDYVNTGISILYMDYPINLRSGEYSLLIYSYINDIKLSTYSLGVTNLNIRGLFNKLSSNWSRDTTQVLCLSLATSVPIATTSSIELSLTADKEFSHIDYHLPTSLSDGANITLLADDTLLTNTFDKTLSKQVVLSIENSITSLPVIDIGSSKFIGTSQESLGTWISKKRDFSTPYKNVEVSIDFSISKLDHIDIYISSNEGMTWTKLFQRLPSLLLDANSLLYTGSWYIEDLSNYEIYINQHQEEVLAYRTSITIRIDISNNINTLSFFRNLFLRTY